MKTCILALSIALLPCTASAYPDRVSIDESHEMYVCAFRDVSMTAYESFYTHGAQYFASHIEALSLLGLCFHAVIWFNEQRPDPFRCYGFHERCATIPVSIGPFQYYGLWIPLLKEEE